MKKFFSQFMTGIRSYLYALNFIANQGLRYYYFFPFILLIILLVGDLGVSAYVTDFTGQWLRAHLLSDTQTWYYSLLNGVVFTLIWLIIKIVFIFIFAYVSGFVVIIILSPIFSQLSERVEQINQGTDYPFNLKQMFKDVLRGIILALKNFIIEIGFMILALLFSFIPVVGLLSPVLLFVVSAYFYGFSFMDYTNERQKRSVKESSKLISQNKGLSIGIGFIFALVLLIPVIGSLISGFVAVVTVVAATLAMQEIQE